jgi:GGDEF domain-containing protein
VGASRFRLRGQDRRQGPRGPDRRNARPGHRIRELARDGANTEIVVTVSIGVATATAQYASAKEVIAAADKALYRAKASGRNRLEMAGDAPKRRRLKAAGIA